MLCEILKKRAMERGKPKIERKEPQLNIVEFPPEYLVPSFELQSELSRLGVSYNDLQLVLQKDINASDLAKTQNRLQLSTQQLDDAFFTILTNKEKQQLLRGANGLEVKVLGRTGKDYVLTLGFIDQSKTSSPISKKKKGTYRIRGKNYSKFILENKFVEKQKVSVWMGRSAEEGVAVGELIMLLINFDERPSNERVATTTKEVEQAAMILVSMKYGRRLVDS